MTTTQVCAKCRGELNDDWIEHVHRLRAEHGMSPIRPLICEICLLSIILENPDELLSSVPRNRQE
jgi:hypothetical protein